MYKKCIKIIVQKSACHTKCDFYLLVKIKDAVEKANNY